jgi:4-methyl-5(b-hydroxyethyl)-thiazole monophosphate biosynthesis
MTKTILVPVAHGTEALEAVAIIDILRRAKALVTVASVSGSSAVVGSHGIQLTADCLIEACTEEIYDLVVLPGGVPGVEHLRDSAPLVEILKEQVRQGRLYAGICAAPAVVFESHGLVGNHRVTCHPSFKDRLKNRDLSSLPVVRDGNLVTGRGAGTAVAFALTLVETLFDLQTRKTVETGLALN